MEVTIENFQDIDLDAVIQIYNYTTKKLNWKEFNKDQKRIALYTEKNKPWCLKTWNNNITLVAKVNGNQVGFISMDKTGDFYHFYILPKYLGKGIGSKLYWELEKKARELKIRKIHMFSSDYALDTYLHFGYKNLGRKKDVWDDGVEFNDWYLEKELK